MATIKPDAIANPKPGSRGFLKFYWTKSPEGLAKWTTSPHPYTALLNHLLKFMNPVEAHKTAAQWFHDTLGFWPGTPHVGIIPTPKLKK